MPDYRKLDLEKLRADLARAARDRPPLLTNAKALLDSLKPELAEMLRVGYTARDITEKLKEHGVDLKLGTIQSHLRQMRLTAKRPRRRATSTARPEAAVQSADKPALARVQQKQKPSLFDGVEDEVAP